MATIAARPHGAVIPLIIALRRQAPQWRKRLRDFLLVMIIARWGRAPIVAEIQSFLTARAEGNKELVSLLFEVLLRKTTI